MILLQYPLQRKAYMIITVTLKNTSVAGGAITAICPHCSAPLEQSGNSREPVTVTFTAFISKLLNEHGGPGTPKDCTRQ
jgi:hypothetical protein